MLKIFIPDQNDFLKKPLVPFLQPFFSNNHLFTEPKKGYEKWVQQIAFVEDICHSDLVVPAHSINYYYASNQKSKLIKMNESARKAFKLMVCFTHGDWGITPPLRNYHLYRYGGYLSKNQGNQFCCPKFEVPDPVQEYYGGVLPFQFSKPLKPVIGFCGRASPNPFYYLEDIVKNFSRAALKLIGKRYEDSEKYNGSAYKRYQILSALEKSNLITTNFVKLNSFSGYQNSPHQLSKHNYYQHLKDSHYVLCYRGWGNFSIRFYETLSAGRIPVIISTDNNLPFMHTVDWNIFPVIDEKEIKNLDKKLYSYHLNLSSDDFVAIQHHARNIWKNYLTLDGFMERIVDQYLTNRINISR